jgi:hypothetical protein
MLGPGTESVLGPLFRNFLRREGGVVWRLTLPETIKCGVFEYNSCNIWLETGPLYSPGPVQLYALYPPQSGTGCASRARIINFPHIAN